MVAATFCGNRRAHSPKNHTDTRVDPIDKTTEHKNPEIYWSHQYQSMMGKVSVCTGSDALHFTGELQPAVNTSPSDRIQDESMTVPI